MDRAWFLAWHGREPVGIVAGDCDPAGPGHERHIVSMWVAPAARGTGAAQALMTAVTGWARQQGVRTVRLWVTDSSARARAFYQRSGFSPTGERQPVDTDPDTAEAEFRMDFDAAGPPAAMSPAAPSRGVGRTTGR